MGIGGISSSVGWGVDVFRPQNHSPFRVGAIGPEPSSKRLMVGSITNGLNQIIASFRLILEAPVLPANGAILGYRK